MRWVTSCERVAQLLSQSLDEPLGALDRLRLKIHLSICADCRNVKEQLSAVRSLSEELFSSDELADAHDAQAGTVEPADRTRPGS